MAKGYTKRIIVSNRATADLFLAKDFIDLGGINNQSCYRSQWQNGNTINFSGNSGGGYTSYPQTQFQTVDAPAVSVTVLVNTTSNNIPLTAWSDATQIESYTAGTNGFMGGEGVVVYYGEGTFPTGSILRKVPGYTWWNRSFIVLDRNGRSGTLMYTAQRYVYETITGSATGEMDQNYTSCYWNYASSNGTTGTILSGTNLASATGAVSGSCSSGGSPSSPSGGA